MFSFDVLRTRPQEAQPAREELDVRVQAQLLGSHYTPSHEDGAAGGDGFDAGLRARIGQDRVRGLGQIGRAHV